MLFSRKLIPRPFALLVLAVIFMAHDRSAWAREGTYSGKARVEHLGLVAFPPGQWYLEASRVQKDANLERQAREYFVFRRADAEAERLTIVRYNQFLRRQPLADLMNDEHFRFGNGLPDEERRNGADAGEIRVRKDLRRSDVEVESTFVTAYAKPKAVWMCHTYLTGRYGWMFVFVHASTRVLDPTAVLRVESGSKLRTDLPKGLFAIPPQWVGWWEAPQSGIYLASDGKCVESQGMIDVSFWPITGFYDAESKTLDLSGYRYRVDEKTMTLTPMRGQKGAPAGGMDQKFRKTNGDTKFAKELVESMYKDGR